MKVISDRRSEFPIKAIGMKKPKKHQGLYESFHIQYVISLLSRETKNSQLTSLPMCGFIAQLVEHYTGIAEVTGSNSVEALIFFQASSFQLL